MTSHDLVLLVVAAVLVLLAGLFAGAEAALSSYSKVRANEQVELGNLRAVRLRDLLSDAPRYLNSLLLLRLMLRDHRDRAGHPGAVRRSSRSPGNTS